MPILGIRDLWQRDWPADQGMMVTVDQENVPLKTRFMKVPSFGPLETVDCAICGTVESSLVVVQSLFGEDFHVVRCRQCGLMYTNPRPTPEWKANFYDPKCNGYMDFAGRDFVYEPSDDRLPGYHRIIEFLQEQTKPDASLLDAGCANGLFVKTAKDAGFNATGCDYSEMAVANGLEKYGVQLIHSPIERVAVEDNSFDVVTLLHVYEHLDKPIDVLQEVSRILKPGGLMLLETVNYLPHYYIEKYFRFLIPIYNNLTKREGLPWVPFDHLYHWAPGPITVAAARANMVEMQCHLLRGYRSAKATGKLAFVYRMSEFVGEMMMRLSAGRCNYWPVLMLTARKPE